MAADLEDALLERYLEELTFLRRMGGRFARKHPRIAKRLELSDEVSQDPLVERLIESVAFLTARLQVNLKAEIPEVVQGLLGHTYPHFNRPVPSMAIAQFHPDGDGAGMTEAETIPAGTKLFVETSYQRRTCRFRTASATQMWPIRVTEARFESPNAFPFLTGRQYASVRTVLRLQLTTLSEPLKDLKPETLRFFLKGEQALTGGMYELLTTSLFGVACLPNGTLPGRGGVPMMVQGAPEGFDPDGDLLPTAPNALRGFSLLQEYFALPEKFLFYEISGIDASEAEDTLELLFLFDAMPRKRLSVRPDTFALGCTPIINLFEKVSEPVTITGRATEYLVVPDTRWERTTEIHTVLGVTPSLTLEDDVPIYEPIFGHRHSLDHSTVYWKSTRRPARNEGTPGSDFWLSFVDDRLKDRPPVEEVLRVHALCTNRDLPTFIDKGEQLHVEDGPYALVSLLTRPTPPMDPPTQGAGLWRLISHLGLSHTGLPNEPEALGNALREQLRLYAFTTNESLERQLQALVKVEKRTVALRADDQKWRGFVRVQRMTLTVDESRFDGISPILLGAVLRHYFGLHASINVFTQLELVSKQREGTWYRWPPMIPETHSSDS